MDEGQVFPKPKERLAGFARFVLALTLVFAGGGLASALRISEIAALSTNTANAAVGSAQQEQVRREFLRGYQAQVDGDYAQAARVFSALEGRYPELGDYVLFYLGRAQSKLGSASAAEASFERLLRSYPQSLLAERSEFELAKLALEQAQFTRAEQIAVHLMPKITSTELEGETRVVLAGALVGRREIREADAQLEQVRQEMPHSAADAKARVMQTELRQLYPSIIGLHTAEEFRSEAELLYREGLAAQALTAVDKALSLHPSADMTAEILWIEARAAAHVDRARQKRALDRYLELAPNGAAAPQATYALGLWYWHEDQTALARDWFARVARRFAASPLAAEAMLRAARIAEEEGDLNLARTEYLRLAARYPQSDAGEQAQFRAPWMLYMSENYRAAGEQFSGLRERTPAGAARDRFGYWEARAWEKSGQPDRARTRFATVAQSLASNYYPALAARRIGEDPPILATVDLVAGRSPRVNGPAAFHLVRADELAALGLKRQTANELLALVKFAREQSSLRNFVLVELQAAQAYYDAIMVAVEMEQRGELDSAAAERLRYPRAYWDWIGPIGARIGLDPYLLLAVARQESLFNPNARSPADARGLMQLLPATAGRLGNGPRDQVDLYDPQRNLELGALELKRLLNRFGDDLFKAVAAYNAGEQAVERWNSSFSGDDDEWVENIEYKETRRYVKRVIGGLREYRMLYGPPTHRSTPSRAGSEEFTPAADARGGAAQE
jgi:soluble lytic murein transglycosylase